METMLVSPPSSRSGAAASPREHRSRIGRRVIGLFIVSALVPLCLCAALLLHGFGAELHRAQREDLDGLVRSFSMMLLGRLNNGDDGLEVISRQPGMNDSAIQDAVGKLLWERWCRYLRHGYKWILARTAT